MTTNKQTVYAYDNTVELYIATSPQEVMGDLKEWIDTVLARTSKDAKILELGSGSGKDARYFDSKGYKVEMTDASQGFVDHLIKTGMDARILDALADDYGIDYDMIFSNAVFLHFTEDELKLVLEKCLSALKTHGMLAFTVKAGSGEETTTRKLNTERYFHYWQKNGIETLLNNAGYREVQVLAKEDYHKDGRPDWLYVTALK